MTPAFGITTASAAIAVCVLLFAGTVKGTLGFGVSVASVPLLIQFFSPKTTLAVLTVPFVVTNVSLLRRDGVPWEFLADHVPFVVVLVTATVVGSYALAVLPVDAVSLVVSAYLFAFLAFRRYGESVYRYADRRGVPTAAGVAGGLLGGALGMPGPPLVTYVYARARGDERLFVTGVSAMFVVSYAMRLPSLLLTDFFGVAQGLLGLGATVPLLLGVSVGTRIRESIPSNWFERFVELFVFLVAVQIGADALDVVPV